MASQTRQKLLEAGADRFSAAGYDKTTVGEIEKAAGLTPRAGGFYRHFKSKDDLLLAIAHSRFETPTRLGLTEVLPLGDTRAELIYIARAYDRLNQDRDGLAYLIRVEAARKPALKKMIVEANEALLKSLYEWISAKPLLQDAPPETISAHVIMVFGGWLFFLSRRDELSSFQEAQSETMLQQWAQHWAGALDRRPVQ